MILAAADEDTAPAVDVLPGPAHEAPHLPRVLDRTAARVPAIDEAAGDKGFDGDPQRGGCLDRGVCPVIPNKANRVDPWPFDPLAYRERNRVERPLGKLKQYRRVATRYDKLKATLLGCSF